MSLVLDIVISARIFPSVWEKTVVDFNTQKKPLRSENDEETTHTEERAQGQKRSRRRKRKRNGKSRDVKWKRKKRKKRKSLRL